MSGDGNEIYGDKVMEEVDEGCLMIGMAVSG